MRCRLAVMGLGLIAASLTSCAGPAAAKKAASPPIRIGVYDSRGIAVAYASSTELDQKFAGMRRELEAAKAQGDDKRMKELEQQRSWGHVRLHQQVFSTAGVTDIMAKVAAALPGVAREAGVVLIVSKWEMPYADPSIEIVDVTLRIASLFGPDDRALKTIGQLTAQKPVPFDEISLDPDD